MDCFQNNTCMRHFPDSIVASIRRCHRRDPGSIPGREVLFFSHFALCEGYMEGLGGWRRVFVTWSQFPVRKFCSSYFCGSVRAGWDNTRGPLYFVFNTVRYYIIRI